MGMVDLHCNYIPFAQVRYNNNVSNIPAEHMMKNNCRKENKVRDGKGVGTKVGNIGDMKRMRLRALPILQKQKATKTEKEGNPSIRKIITQNYQTLPEREKY